MLCPFTFCFSFSREQPTSTPSQSPSANPSQVPTSSPSTSPTQCDVTNPANNVWYFVQSNGKARGCSWVASKPDNRCNKKGGYGCCVADGSICQNVPLYDESRRVRAYEVCTDECASFSLSQDDRRGRMLLQRIIEKIDEENINLDSKLTIADLPVIRRKKLSNGNEFNSTSHEQMITLAEAELKLQRLIDEYHGPIGSLSLPKAHPENQVPALLEALDPRMRRDNHHCFRIYYELWRREIPFSGQEFFEWLDFGRGQAVVDESMSSHCTKAAFLDRQMHSFFTDEERLKHEVSFVSPNKEGKLVARYTHSNVDVPESLGSHPYTYIWALDGSFYIAPKVKHMKILSGHPALGAGEIYVGKTGQVKGINFNSGHYRPGIHTAAIMYQYFRDRGYNTSALNWFGRKSWSSKDCNTTNWLSIDVPGINGAALEQSCHELTTSPTWILKDR